MVSKFSTGDQLRCNFVNENLLSFLQAPSLGCDWWEVIIGLDNGLAPNRRQAIIQTNDDPVQQYIDVIIGKDELKSDSSIIAFVITTWVNISE